MPRPAIPVSWLVIVAAVAALVMAVVWIDVAYTSSQAEKANPPLASPEVLP